MNKEVIILPEKGDEEQGDEEQGDSPLIERTHFETQSVVTEQPPEIKHYQS